jgi:hypothetical protein
MNLAGFRDQYARAVTGRTIAERQRHLAGALLAAGALLHVLEDMGSPSHVRNDLAAHFDGIGTDSTDVGSRFERVAALAFARLGVPAVREVIHRGSPREYITSLARTTSERWFSAHTLPGSFTAPHERDNHQLKREIQAHLARPQPGPAVTVRLDDGVLVNASGVCLANLSDEDHQYHFWIGDRCALEQLAVILPETAGYAAGLLDTLLGPTIRIEVEGTKASLKSDSRFGKGKLTLFWDDDSGVRVPYHNEQLSPGALARIVRAPPGDAVRVSALFVGTDEKGAPLVVAGSTALRDETVTGEEETAPEPTRSVVPRPGTEPGTPKDGHDSPTKESDSGADE